MVLSLYSLISSLAVSFLLMPLLIKILHKRHVLDEGGKRKIHKGQIPTMGGIVIFIAFGFAMLAWLPDTGPFVRKYVFSAIALIVLTGFRDDVAPLKPWQKLLAQLVAAAIVVGLSDIRIESFYGFLGINTLPLWISYALSIFAIIVVTNAFNLIDGIDGLAGVVSIISFSFLGYWFYQVGTYEYTIIMCALIGAILGFLYYNWHKAVVFMGDTGSLFIGFVLAIATIAFIKTNGTLTDGDPYKYRSVISMAIAVVLFPLFDTLRVFILRTSQGKSPFSADKQHIHHYLLRIYQTHDKATIVIGAGFFVSILVVQFFAKRITDNLLLPALVITCFVVNILIWQGLVRTYSRKNIL